MRTAINSVICLVFLLALTACQPNAKDSSEQLLLQTPMLQLTLSPEHAPVETPLQLRLHSNKPLRAINAEIQGISMYMGRIPLQWRQQALEQSAEFTVWQAEFFLGACSDPQMQWQLQLILDYQDGERELHQLQFTSSWR
ncbi:hypothetical protein [Alishewanella sp. HL-SH06]|uniref:hypothetical protein n=1 Tax=Alishewanella sp. HL-SH06 TaxID=3461144 RepID=UPI004043581C